MVRQIVAFSDNDNPKRALFEVVTQIEEAAEGRSPILIIFSSQYETFPQYANDLQNRFPDSETIGMSTYVAFTNKGYSKAGLNAMAIFDGINIETGVIFEVGHYPMRHKNVLEEACDKLSDHTNTVCFEFTTAFQNCEELVQDTFRSVFEEKGIPVFGGTAGAQLAYTSSYVSLNGVSYREAAVFALIQNTEGRIRLYKENLFKPTEHYFIATDVDCDSRTVYEFDDTTAAEAIASAIQVPIEELPNVIYKYPVGRIHGDNIYITDPARVWPDGKITYFARIYNRTKLVLLSPDDEDKVWQGTADLVHKDGPFSFSIIINCLGRSGMFYKENHFEAFNNKLTKEYGEFIGVSGYGEQINYEHQNQTLIMAVFE